LQIANNLRTVVINQHQDFVASMHIYFFQGQTGRGMIYRPNHPGETWLSKHSEKDDDSSQLNVSSAASFDQAPLKVIIMMCFILNKSPLNKSSIVCSPLTGEYKILWEIPLKIFGPGFQL
jgi:hypothetical protein